MDYISRAEWLGDDSPIGSPISGAMAYGAWHHTVSETSTDKAKTISLWNRFHRYHISIDNAGIGYSWGVDDAGHIIEGRGWGESGAHTWSFNKLAYAVAWIGDGRFTEPSERAVQAAATIFREGIELGHLIPRPRLQILSHNQFAGNDDTTCAGPLSIARIPAIIQAIEQGAQQDMTNEESLMLQQVHQMLRDNAFGYKVQLSDGTTVGQAYGNLFETTVTIRALKDQVNGQGNRLATIETQMRSVNGSLTTAIQKLDALIAGVGNGSTPELAAIKATIEEALGRLSLSLD